MELSIYVMGDGCWIVADSKGEANAYHLSDDASVEEIDEDGVQEVIRPDDPIRWSIDGAWHDADSEAWEEMRCRTKIQEYIDKGGEVPGMIGTAID